MAKRGLSRAMCVLRNYPKWQVIGASTGTSPLRLGCDEDCLIEPGSEGAHPLRAGLGRGAPILGKGPRQIARKDAKPLPIRSFPMFLANRGNAPGDRREPVTSRELG